MKKHASWPKEMCLNGRISQVFREVFRLWIGIPGRKTYEKCKSEMQFQLERYFTDTFVTAGHFLTL